MYENLLKKLQSRGATLIAVSKTQPVERILELYQQGQRDFGESRVQELLKKVLLLPSDIRWHLIGHLQTNKVRFIAPFIHMIHSVDSLRLLQEIEKRAAAARRTVDCLLQFHIAEEETKYGLVEEEAHAILQSTEYQAMRHVRICGVMGMATLTDDKEKIRAEFRTLRHIFDRLRQTYFANDAHFREISMGMSADWEIALEEGSTMVRIGTLLFGPRT
ncbi:MAG: YggS family pyridoxal phosphate-dependent enzyme [Saprospiraceae bacterium]|nr:YggS family pyridoxal phosphate-dependent enzyme [Saprospiraceae bacterium]MDW8483447.1 YggS family pyridoxal phosphate-dependent enzyme [Saprospiraceae bacterium]